MWKVLEYLSLILNFFNYSALLNNIVIKDFN